MDWADRFVTNLGRAVAGMLMVGSGIVIVMSLIFIK